MDGQHSWRSRNFEIFSPETELKRFLKVEAAWTRAFGEVAKDRQASKVADMILAAKIDQQLLHDGVARDGVPIPALVDLLKSQLSLDSEPWIHQGLTSQDVIDTSLVLALLEVLDLISAQLLVLEKVFEKLQRQFGEHKVTAYTRMQPALETKVSKVITQWHQPLPRVIEDAERLKSLIRKVQWGGPIGIRDHENAEELGAAFAGNLGLTDSG